MVGPWKEEVFFYVQKKQDHIHGGGRSPGGLGVALLRVYADKSAGKRVYGGVPSRSGADLFSQ